MEPNSFCVYLVSLFLSCDAGIMKQCLNNSVNAFYQTLCLYIQLLPSSREFRVNAIS
jgi:hypothetical protein